MKDMEKFTPKKKSSFEDEIRNYLLKGYIIRYDAQDYNPLEVIGRDYIKDLPRMGNIGEKRDIVKENISCSHSILHNLVKELSSTYSVKKVSCEYSGCCQYSTFGYYLDGE